MADPIVTWYVDESGACKVFMHRGDTLRVFPSPNIVTAERTIEAVSIDAFGMSQDEARAFASAAVADQVKVSTPPADLSEHMALLQDELTDTQAELAAANSKIAELEAQNADLEKSIATMTAIPATNVLPHNPPARETDGAAPEQGPSPGAAAADGAMTDSYGHALPGGKFAPSPAA